jgi:hypothetical protein
MLEPVRFFAEDVMSGVIKTQNLDLHDWSYGQQLNAGVDLTAGIPLTAQDANEEILAPWKTAIYAVRGTNVEWGGLLRPPVLSQGATMLQLSGFDWIDYWASRVIRADVGQPEAGGVVVCRPKSDSLKSDVFGSPDRDDLWRDVQGGYAPTNGILADFVPGDVPHYRATFDVPDLPTLHPIVSVTLSIVATAITSPRAVTPELHIGGVDYHGTIVSTGSAPNQPVDCSFTWALNPATGVAWTVSDVEAFGSGSSAGFLTDPNAIGLDTCCNYLALTVTYAAGISDFFTQTDQFDIFRKLVMNAQSIDRYGPGWDLGIDVVWDAPSGVLRDRVAAYQGYQAKNLGDALRQLAADEDGFDFGMDYTFNANTNRIDKTIKLYYPTKGRDTGFRFEYERGKKTNVISRGFADPVKFAWAGDGWGSGNDATRLRSTYVDDTLRGFYPPYEAAPTWSTEIHQDSLDQKTAAYFVRTQRPHPIPVLSVDPDIDPKWGTYGVGDTIGLDVDDGYGSTSVVPQMNRLTAWKNRADQEFDLTFADPLGDATAEG